MSDDLLDLEERMRAALHVPETPQEAAEQRAIRQAHEAPLPVKVLVSRERLPSEWLEERHRWFFVGVFADGGRDALFNTTHQPTARREAERFQKLGVALEVQREREFE